MKFTFNSCLEKEDFNFFFILLILWCWFTNYDLKFNTCSCKENYKQRFKKNTSFSKIKKKKIKNKFGRKKKIYFKCMVIYILLHFILTKFCVIYIYYWHLVYRYLRVIVKTMWPNYNSCNAEDLFMKSK